MAVQIQIRRGLSTLWTSTNPILGAGEIGIETDTLLMKIGDGSTAWISLTYIATLGAVDPSTSLGTTSKIPTQNAVKVYVDSKAVIVSSAASVADSKAVSAASQAVVASSAASVADSKAVVASSAASTAQVLANSDSSAASTADSKAVLASSAASTAQVLANSDSSAASIADSKAVLASSAASTAQLTASTASSAASVAESTIVAYPSASQTETNKRITRRINTTTSSSAPSINTDTTDEFTITALATAITSMTTGLSGTPVNGDLLEIRILDNGSSQTIAWGTSFVSTTTALPLATVASTTLRILLEWNAQNSGGKWECIGVS
jgi:hypothetical protein